MKIYSYNKCSTCRNAVKFLQEKNIKAEVIDITDSPPNKSALEAMLKIKEGNLKKLFNTSGLVYKELKLKEKFDGLSKKEAFNLLSQNGKLVKRPFLIDSKKQIGLLGFKKDEWEKVLSS